MLRNAILSTALLCGFAGSLEAQLITYRLEVITADVGGAGTDNHIYVTLEGPGGKSQQFTLEGGHEQAEHDPMTKTIKDIGVITKIHFDLENRNLLDDWTPYSITIKRDYRNDGTYDGHSQVILNNDLGFDPTTKGMTVLSKPRVTVTADGKVEFHKTELTIVNFGHNPHPTVNQEVMKYRESWSNVTSIGVTEEKHTTVGAHMTVTYESPETVAGTFGAEAGASWETTMSSATTEVNERMSASEWDWTYTIPAQSAVFRKVGFEVPYADQVYKSSDGDSRIIRKLSAQIVPTGLDDFLFIPRMNGDEIEPISWSEIDAKWMRFIDSSAVQNEIKSSHRPVWIERGWVYLPGKKNEALAILNPAPAPQPQPEAEVTPAPEPTPEPTPEPAAAPVLPLAGYWMDGDGRYLEMKVTDSKVSVKPLSKSLRNEADKGSAKIRDDKSLGQLIMLKDGDVAMTSGVTVEDEGRTIVFADGGRMTHKGTERSALPDEVTAFLQAEHDAANPKFADLVAEIKSYNYGKGKVTVQVIITNKGEVASPVTQCRVFMSPNAKVNKSRDTKLSLKDVKALEPGESVIMKFGEGVKESKVKKAKHVIAVVDYDNRVEESNESNEFGTKIGTVKKKDSGKSGKAGKSGKKDKKKKGKKGGKGRK